MTNSYLLKTFGLYLTKPRLISARNQAIRSAKTVAVEIKERYLREYTAIAGMPPIVRNNSYTPRCTCRDAAKRALVSALKVHGLSSVEIREPHDITIRVQIFGTCIPHLYVWRSGKKNPCYSGATIQGSISLCLSDEKLPTYQRSFFGILNPPQFISDPGLYLPPVRAPFDKAFEESNFKGTLERVLNHFFGKRP